MGQLDGKTVILTGAAQGMGAVHARRCVEEGARVVLTDLQVDAGQALAAELGEGVRFVEQDVTSEPDWDRVVDEATTRFGGIDGLVNNAAIAFKGADPTPFHEQTTPVVDYYAKKGLYSPVDANQKSDTVKSIIMAILAK